MVQVGGAWPLSMMILIGVKTAVAWTVGAAMPHVAGRAAVVPWRLHCSCTYNVERVHAVYGLLAMASLPAGGTWARAWLGIANA